MTEIANISKSDHRQGNKVMAAGESSQRQIDGSLKLGQARQKTIKDYLVSGFTIGDLLLVLYSLEFDDSNGAIPRIELLL